ncbi:hypothetical protein BHM03_00023822 [Ensete ventricosum]|nr:hypothetical protein BHM03_00023822 [Ensete ventricosum]
MCSACARALLSLVPALTIGSFFPYRTTSGRGRIVVASAISDSRRGRTAITSAIGDFRRGRAAGSSPLRAGQTLGCGKGGGFFSPRRLAVSRARDAMDASGQTRHSTLHTAPLFQRDAPLLASSQQPLLVASQRNAPLQQPLQLLVPVQRLRPVSHQDVPPLVSSRQDAPSMNQARGRSRSRSRPLAPISRDPRPLSSLFKAPVGSLDLRLDFFAPEVQADQKIVVYDTIDSDELIET